MSDARDSSAPRGWIFYDAECRFCTSAANRFTEMFQRRGFHFLPLQTAWVSERLGLEADAPLAEMRVLTSDGADLSGADAIVFLARQVWWARPLYAFAHLPGGRAVAHRAYRWFAAHRSCNHNTCQAKPRRAWPAWVALLLLPTLALLARDRVPPWVFMWIMCSAIFLACKSLTFWRARQRPEISTIRALAYFFAWPGMDAEKFLRPVRQRRLPSLQPVLFATTKALFGAVLLFVIARLAGTALLAGWIGMIGLIFLLHFGLFHLLAIGWRSAGVEVESIMNAPWRATSLGEFWGRRWNGAFNQLALDHVFRPLSRRLSVPVATLGAFLVSGLIHESVISLPANAGYGLPTAYFLLQGGGVLVERSVRKIRGHTFTVLVTAAPAFWLFHPPFVRAVILPFMRAIGAL